ncbi:MAG: hypothetical protein ACI8TQ_001858 [Planctomycetota bacterium]|jgi:hypothetical protein
MNHQTKVRIGLGTSATVLASVIGLILFDESADSKSEQWNPPAIASPIQIESSKEAPKPSLDRVGDPDIDANPSGVSNELTVGGSSQKEPNVNIETVANGLLSKAEGRLRITVLDSDRKTCALGTRVTIDTIPSTLEPFALEVGDDHKRLDWTLSHPELELIVPANVAFVIGATGDTKRTTRTALKVKALDKNEERSVTVILTERRSLEFYGRVVAAESEEPIEGATVRLRGVSKSDRPDLDPKTDVQGRFAFTVKDWPTTATVVAPDRPAVTVTIDARHEHPTFALRVPVPKWGALDVSVTDFKISDLGLEDVTLQLVYDEPPSPLRLSHQIGSPVDPTYFGAATGTTDGDGKFSFEQVLPDRKVMVVASRFGEWLTNQYYSGVPSGERAELVIPYSGQIHHSGMLQESDEISPIPDCELWLVPWSFNTGIDDAGFFTFRSKPFHTVRTDEFGRFKTPNIHSGFWWIGPAPGTDVAPVTTRFHAGNQRSELLLESSTGLMITGIVVVPHGEVPKGTVVSLSSSKGGSDIKVALDEDDRFSLGSVPWKNYAVFAITPPRSAFATKRTSAYGGEDHLEIELCMAGRLFGHVVDEQGKPMNGRAWLSSSDSDSKPGALFTTPVRDGFMLFEDIPGIEYDLFYRSSDDWFAHKESIDIVNKGPDVGELVAYPGGMLTITDPDNKGWMAYSVYWNQIPVAQCRESVSMEVPFGNLTVDTMWSLGRVRNQSVNVESGESLSFEYDF